MFKDEDIKRSFSEQTRKQRVDPHKWERLLRDLERAKKRGDHVGFWKAVNEDAKIPPGSHFYQKLLEYWKK